MVVLVRHGRTAWNLERRFLGATDLPLDEVGRAEAVALGRAAGGRFDAVYASPLVRALDTARALAPPEPAVVDGLRELGHGALEGLEGTEAIALHPAFFRAFVDDPTHVRLPGGGETFAEVRDRALSALAGILASHRPGERVAVVTHQVVIATVTSAILGVPLAGWRSQTIPNGAAVALGWDGRWSIAVPRWQAG
ncbi:MAG: histidine phosphatase family protein [Myxococcota bacterium]